MIGQTAGFDHVRSVVKSVAGFTLDKGKDYLIQNRLTPLATKLGLNDLDELINVLVVAGSGSEIEGLVIDALTINETSFFRDKLVFEHLQENVLPDRIAANRDLKQLKILSAACSTGQEIYSIAILLNERFPELNNWQISLQATDISERVLAQAKEGVYSDFELSRGLAPNLKEKHFTQVSAYDWRISEQLRRSVHFSKHNLFSDWEGMGQFDIVLMRNVLIYFEIPEKRSILSKVRGHLAPGGHLLLGASETTSNIDSSWICEGRSAASFRVRDELKRSIGL